MSTEHSTQFGSDRIKLRLCETGEVESRTVDPVELVLDKVGEIAVLPQVICQIVDMTGSDDASTQSLERAILVDPGFSARLIAQANSAYYALPRKVTSIREAVLFLGFKSVRQLAMTVGVFDLFVGRTDKESLRRRTWWRTSLDAAVAARVVAERVRGINADEAYTCGLLHLIGKTLLCRYDPAKYERVQGVVEQGAPDVLAERAVFDCDHIGVGLAAAKKWSFPESLVAGLNYFSPVTDRTPENLLRATTAVASRIAKLTTTGKPTRELSSNQLPAWTMEVLMLQEEDADKLMEAAFESIEKAEHVMVT
ncbi:MAG: HDOD domain-containing protein [Fimbriimonadaceae bacterium]|nr:HDOD domain-containing protein [Fimbriimonadaceae bacterium]QYK54727.1 MAG: HDOD domain-containing protein [Fimbriimonadaceae bacterium]